MKSFAFKFKPLVCSVALEDVSAKLFFSGGTPEFGYKKEIAGKT